MNHSATTEIVKDFIGIMWLSDENMLEWLREEFGEGDCVNMIITEYVLNRHEKRQGVKDALISALDTVIERMKGTNENLAG